MRLMACILMTSLLVSAGCRLGSNAPNPQWLADFQKTDAILIQYNNQELTVSDTETINRLQNIYTNAKWKPYWHTLPANLNERTIELREGQTKLRNFSYTGSLWESESYTKNRTAELSDTDKNWIESLFAKVPKDVASSVVDEVK